MTCDKSVQAHKHSGMLAPEVPDKKAPAYAALVALAVKFTELTDVYGLEPCHAPKTRYFVRPAWSFRSMPVRA